MRELALIQGGGGWGVGTTTDTKGPLAQSKGSAVAQFCRQLYRGCNVGIFVFRRQATSILKHEIVLILEQRVDQTNHV